MVQSQDARARSVRDVPAPPLIVSLRLRKHVVIGYSFVSALRHHPPVVALLDCEAFIPVSFLTQQKAMKQHGVSGMLAFYVAMKDPLRLAAQMTSRGIGVKATFGHTHSSSASVPESHGWMPATADSERPGMGYVQLTDINLTVILGHGLQPYEDASELHYMSLTTLPHLSQVLAQRLRDRAARYEVCVSIKSHAEYGRDARGTYVAPADYCRMANRIVTTRPISPSSILTVYRLDRSNTRGELQHRILAHQDLSSGNLVTDDVTVGEDELFYTNDSMTASFEKSEGQAFSVIGVTKEAGVRHSSSSACVAWQVYRR